MTRCGKKNVPHLNWNPQAAKIYVQWALPQQALKATLPWVRKWPTSHHKVQKVQQQPAAPLAPLQQHSLLVQAQQFRQQHKYLYDSQ
jgi:hypothetical protein